MKSRRFIITGIAGALAALLIPACSSAGGPEPSGGTLRIGQNGSADIDFSFSAQNPETSLMAKGMYDSLLTSEDGGTAMTPGLATEWSYDESRTTLTLTLREGVTFSDGSAFDAEDVKATLDFANESQAFLVNYADSEITDEHAITIHLTEATGVFLVYLRQLSITSTEAIADPDSMVKDPVGTGPYVLNRDDSIEASSYVLDKRDDAWEADVYPFDQLVFKLVGDDPSAALNALRAGQVDFVAGTDASTADAAVANGFEAITYPFVYLFIHLDTSGRTAPALADVRVRQALNYAFDREGIAESVNYGYGNPTSQIEANPDSPFYRPGRDDEYAYDIDRAKELLAEAGYPDGFDMSLVVVESGFAAYGPIVRQTFADIGINLDYVAAGNDEWFDEYASGRYSALVMGSTPGEVTGDYSVENTILNPWPNSTPEMTEILETLNAGTDEEIAQASADLSDYLLDEAWIIVFAHPEVVQVADSSVVTFREYKSWLGQIPLRAMIPAS
jgi:peptide/nickel transport system substrate-binding protein